MTKSLGLTEVSTHPDDETFDPWAWCEARGIEVVTRPISGPRWGEWHPAQRRIILQAGLTASQELSILCHECGHAWHLHVGCTPRGERAADAWAADRLVRPESYARAEALYGLDITMLAAELGVMEWVVLAWRRSEEERRRWAGYFGGQDLIA